MDKAEKEKTSRKSVFAGAGVAEKGTAKKRASLSAEKDQRYKKEDLKKLGLLGCGGFGTVTLEEHKQTGKTFALKQLSKGFVVKMGMQDSVMNEKFILSMTNSPFIVKLYETYNGAHTARNSGARQNACSL